MLQPFHAELLVRDGERRAVHAGDGDEGRKIRALAGQFLGELETGARRGGLRIHRIIQQAKAMLAAQALILRARFGDFAQFERKPQSIERGPPQLALGEALAEHGRDCPLPRCGDLVR